MYLDIIFIILLFLQLLFPIVTNGHWSGFVVDFEYKVFAFLDSLLDQNSPFHLATKNHLVSEFLCFIHIVLQLLFLHFFLSLSFVSLHWFFQIDNFIHLWEVIISEITIFVISKHYIQMSLSKTRGKTLYQNFLFTLLLTLSILCLFLFIVFLVHFVCGSQ